MRLRFLSNNTASRLGLAATSISPRSRDAAKWAIDIQPELTREILEVSVHVSVFYVSLLNRLAFHLTLFGKTTTRERLRWRR
jgi:hypothetical protein